MLEQRSFINSTKNELYNQLLSSINQNFGHNSSDQNFSQYQNDPVGFSEEVLGETYTDEVKVMMESVRDNPITIAKSPNAVGKTHGAARVATWWYQCFPNSQVYTAAAPPESNLKRLLWGEILSITNAKPDLFTRDIITSLQIASGPQEFIAGVTIPVSGSAAVREAKFSGKHAPHLLFILDEGDAIPDEVYKGIESCMSGGHARLLVMFNPRAEVGEAYRMERDGRANIVHLSAMNHPNVITGNDVIPGAVTRQTTVRRINQWCRPLTQGETRTGPETFKLPDYLEGEVALSQKGTPYLPLKPGHYKIMEPAFSYMVLGRYPAQGTTQLISKEWTAAARARWDEYVAENGETPVGFGVQGQDIAEYGSDSNVACFRYGDFVDSLISWDGIDILSTADRSLREYKERKLDALNVDATGVGSGVVPHMERNGLIANPVKVASRPTESSELGEFKILRDQLWWSCREWLRVSNAMLPPDEDLLEELHTPTYKVENGKIRVMAKDTIKELIKRSPDKADALCLTFYEPASLVEPLDLMKCAV